MYLFIYQYTIIHCFGWEERDLVYKKTCTSCPKSFIVEDMSYAE